MLHKYLFKNYSFKLISNQSNANQNKWSCITYQIHSVGKGTMRQDLSTTAARNKIHRKKKSAST